MTQNQIKEVTLSSGGLISFCWGTWLSWCRARVLSSRNMAQTAFPEQAGLGKKAAAASVALLTLWLLVSVPTVFDRSSFLSESGG